MATTAPIPTGVPGLDLVLSGGLTRSALVLLVGSAGAGKTVLATQMLFHVVRHAIPCLILTTQAEGNVKLLDHIREFSFYDAAAVGDTVTLMSLPAVVGTDIDQAAASLIKTIRETGAKMVLLDGFQSMADQFPDRGASRRLLAAVGLVLTYLDITLLVTLTGTARESLPSNALTIADVVINLEFGIDGWRHRRRLEVLKQRGRAQLPGLHSYRITSDGVWVEPRLEARPLGPSRPRPSGRIPMGLPALDALLSGGITAGTTTLIVGAPGVGKTTLALYWTLEGAQRAGTSLFLSFEERPADLQAKAMVFDLPIAAALDSGTFTILYVSPVEIDPDAVASLLLEQITPATERVVIDNFLALVGALGPRTHEFLAALNSHLYTLGVTTLLLVEIKPFVGFAFDVADSALSLLADNILMIQQVAALGVVRRILAVLKMRYSAFDATVRELIIDEQGVRVLSAPESATGVLDAAATASGLTAPGGDAAH